MKKIFQAVALILLTALVVYAGIHSHPDSEEIYKREWSQSYGEEKPETTVKKTDTIDTEMTKEGAMH